MKLSIYLISFLWYFISSNLLAQNKLEEIVKDIDGNVYHTVKIENQTWMVENLKTTKYRNGEPIPNVTDNKTWLYDTIGAYCSYNNDENTATTYGRLYNWFSVDDRRNIAPSGWHVATDSDWMVLTNFLGGEKIAGGKLKETGFTALLGGWRYPFGQFAHFGSGGYWWSSTENDTLATNSWLRYISYGYSSIYRYFDAKEYGYSVRCLKNEPATEVNENKESHPQFSLSQNYPNPFNPSTIISYTVGANYHSPVHVQLRVYDILGREVACLVNEKKQAGSYQVKFDGKNLTSGIYFYKLVVSGLNPLQTQKYFEMKKMILIK